MRSNRRKRLFNYMRNSKGQFTKGFKHTEESKRKIGEAQKGKKLSKEIRMKISETLKGHKVSQESREKMSKNNSRHWLGKTDDKSSSWKGNNVGIIGVHAWVRRHKGKPEICEHCGITDKKKLLDWANKNHTYKRKLEDYFALCRSCHMKYDYKHNKRNHS